MERGLRADTAADALGLSRIVVYGLWLVMLARAPLPGVVVFPFEWFEPWGVLALCPEAWHRALLSSGGLWGVYLSACVLAALLTAGARPHTPLAIGFVAVIMLYESLLKGFGGYSNHAQYAPLYAAMVMAIFPAADGFSVFGARRKLRDVTLYVAPFYIVMFVISLTYMMIGVRRVVRGGLGIYFDDTIAAYLVARSLEYGAYGYEYGLLVCASSIILFMAKCGYFVTTAFEVLSPLCVVYKRFRWVWLAVIVPFHFMSMLTMNIFFWENVVLLCVFFTGVPVWLATAKQRTLPGEHAVATG